MQRSVAVAAPGAFPACRGLCNGKAGDVVLLLAPSVLGGFERVPAIIPHGASFTFDVALAEREYWAGSRYLGVMTPELPGHTFVLGVDWVEEARVLHDVKQVLSGG